jgi:hypothetical protein
MATSRRAPVLWTRCGKAVMAGALFAQELSGARARRCMSTLACVKPGGHSGRSLAVVAHVVAGCPKILRLRTARYHWVRQRVPSLPLSLATCSLDEHLSAGRTRVPENTGDRCERGTILSQGLGGTYATGS